jgi:hypothetical protein
MSRQECRIENLDTAASAAQYCVRKRTGGRRTLPDDNHSKVRADVTA